MITAVMPTYGRKDVVFERGEGNYLYATDGRRYVDFTSGIAVNALGHCHPALVKALTEQGAKLWHTSNLFRIGNGEKLAKRLTDLTFADTMFFCNSGAEAIEGGIKLIRKYQYMNGHPKRYKIICFQAAFHGRLLNALAATGNPQWTSNRGEFLGLDMRPADTDGTLMRIEAWANLGASTPELVACEGDAECLDPKVIAATQADPPSSSGSTPSFARGNAMAASRNGIAAWARLVRSSSSAQSISPSPWNWRWPLRSQ